MWTGNGIEAELSIYDGFWTWTGLGLVMSKTNTRTIMLARVDSGQRYTSQCSKLPDQVL